MGTIRVRFILVALVVSFFAVGMSAFLNSFKYKSTIGGIVKSRMLVIGRGIENSVQAALMIGMQFSDLATMNQLLARERSSDRMIRGIDVFDSAGQVLYSSDRERVGRKVPDDWIGAAERSKTTEWTAEAPGEYVAGISVRNAFDLTVGFLAMRYTRDDVDKAAAAAGREILLSALIAFGGIVVIAPLALTLVVRRFERDMTALEAAASHIEERAPAAGAGDSSFHGAVGTLRASLAGAHSALDEVRAKLDAAG